MDERVRGRGNQICGRGTVDEAVARLDEQVTRLIRQLRNPASRRLLTAGVEEPLERAQHIVLARVARCEPVRLSSLATQLQVDVSTASRQVSDLVDLGLVRRTPDPDDGRATRLSTTETGDRRLAEMRAARRRGLAMAMDQWAPAETASLADLLARLSDDLGAAVAASSTSPGD